MIQHAPLYQPIPQYYVYIIRGVDDYYYCGLTGQIEKRLLQHQRGESRSTRKHKPFTIVYLKKVFSRKEARYYEKGIKAYGVKRYYLRESISERIQTSRIIIKELSLPVGIGGTGSTSEQVRTVPPMGI